MYVLPLHLVEQVHAVHHLLPGPKYVSGPHIDPEVVDIHHLSYHDVQVPSLPHTQLLLDQLVAHKVQRVDLKLKLM